MHKEGRKLDPSLLQVRLGANFVKDLVVGVRHRFFFHAPLPRLSGAPANPPAIISHVFIHFRRWSTIISRWFRLAAHRCACIHVTCLLRKLVQVHQNFGMTLLVWYLRITFLGGSTTVLAISKKMLTDSVLIEVMWRRNDLVRIRILLFRLFRLLILHFKG